MFGRDTIRRFPPNVSDMQNLAARDYEDLLQCAMPCFKGLFSANHDVEIQSLSGNGVAFSGEAAHAYGIHSDSSSDFDWNFLAMQCARLRMVSVANSRLMRPTLKLRGVHARAARVLQKGTDAIATTASSTRREKTFNLDTYKFHAFGDFPFYYFNVRHLGQLRYANGASVQPCRPTQILIVAD